METLNRAHDSISEDVITMDYADFGYSRERLWRVEVGFTPTGATAEVDQTNQKEYRISMPSQYPCGVTEIDPVEINGITLTYDSGFDT
jgi:hypothetical protein